MTKHTAETLMAVPTVADLMKIAMSDGTAMALVTAELERRAKPVASLSCFYTQNGGVYVSDPAWVAKSKPGAKNPTYTPSVTFACKSMIVDICTPGTDANNELLRLANLPADDVAKLVEAHATKKRAQLVTERAKLVAAGDAKKLAEFDKENPTIASVAA